MKAAYSILAVASAALAAPSSVKHRGQAGNHLAARSGNSSTAGTKIILDNDWSTAGFLTYLMALDSGWDVLGIIGDTGDSWALQTSLHGLATLEVGNLSECIPVYKGSDYPLVNTPELFQTWEDLHGDLAWVRIPHAPTRLLNFRTFESRWLTPVPARRVCPRERHSRGRGQRPDLRRPAESSEGRLCGGVPERDAGGE